MPIDRFAPLTRSLKPRKASLPLRRLVLEAAGLAELVEVHWEPRRAGRALLPGLAAAAAAVGLTREVSRDLRDLASAVQSADAELGATKARRQPFPLAEARRLLGELRAPLRFLLGSRAATRRAFAALEGPKGWRSAYAMASALETHAAFAEKHATELARLGDFSADLPERARRLAQALRLPRRDEARPEKLLVRDALATLLMDRMRAVRATVRFVFREHPALVRKATSDYERKRKRKNGRKRAATRT